jgi:hypothetical protein
MAAKKTRPMTPTEAENRGSLNSVTSSDGNSMRRSYRMKPVRMTTEAASAPQASISPKPFSPPSMTP